MTQFLILKKCYLSVFIILISFSFSIAQPIHIIPEPNLMEVESEFVNFSSSSFELEIVGFDSNQQLLDQIEQIVHQYLNMSVHLDGEKSKKSSSFSIRKDFSVENKEGYELEVQSTGINLRASTEAGVLYGLQTLEQYFASYPNLKSTKQINKLTIEDYPRFPFRALMLDPARHFLPVTDIKRYIDLMAFYKFNALHLHLVDDHGWRVEIKEYPRLTEVGSKRDATFNDEFDHFGFYTQEELKDLVDYASQLNVEIIPEIDIPGHGHALLTAYPELACFPDTTLTAEIHEAYPRAEPICIGNPKFYSFYETVIQELATIFPSKRFHVGGDEVNKEAWSECPKCQNLKVEEGFDKDDQLMDYLFKKVTEIAIKNEKEIVFWHEAGHQYPAGQTITLWRLGTAQDVIADAIKQKLKLICAPGEYAYFDYAQSVSDKDYMPKWIPVLSLEKAYQFDPGYGLSKDESSFIIGVEATMWGESIKNLDRLFYMTFPRGFALAEAGWTEMNKRSWDVFKQKTRSHLSILLNKGVNYRPPTELFQK